MRTFVVVTLATLGLATAEAQATCGSATCFLFNNTTAGLPEPGGLLVDLSWRYVAQDRGLEGRHRTDRVLTPKIDFENETIEPDHHQEISTLNSHLDLGLMWGAMPRLSLVGTLPLVVRRDHEHFDDADTPDPVFSDDDGGAGFGDVQAGVRYGFIVGARDVLDGTLTLEAPTGAWKQRDSEGGIGEPGLQPGSGSWDVLASVHYARQVRPQRLEWFTTGSYRANGTNGLDYRLGDEWILGTGFEGAIGTRAYWSLQANARWAGRDEYLGEGVPSTGSTWVALTPGLRSAGRVSFYGYAQVPVYESVNETNLAPRYGLQLGVSTTF
jgi:hypothetical protein